MRVADDILSGDILPRKIELEQKYLEEALDLLANKQVSLGCCRVTVDYHSLTTLVSRTASFRSLVPFFRDPTPKRSR